MILEDYEKLFEDGNFLNITLKVEGDKTIMGHTRAYCQLKVQFFIHCRENINEREY